MKQKDVTVKVKNMELETLEVASTEKEFLAEKKEAHRLGEWGRGWEGTMTAGRDQRCQTTLYITR